MTFSLTKKINTIKIMRLQNKQNNMSFRSTSIIVESIMIVLYYIVPKYDTTILLCIEHRGRPWCIRVHILCFNPIQSTAAQHFKFNICESMLYLHAFIYGCHLFEYYLKYIESYAIKS